MDWYEITTNDPNQTFHICIMRGANILAAADQLIYGHLVLVGIKKVSKCWGCRNDQPNQLAHMRDSTGCLFLKEE